MPVSSLHLADYMDLFTGNIHNYGVHQYNFKPSGKEAGSNTTVTNKLLTIEQYKKHLNGEIGLGIIPINDSNEVKFAVIDIDVYDVQLDTYIAAIEDNNLPLIPFKSKSGGLHLYTFFKQPVAAKTAVDAINKLAAVLGLDLFVKRQLNRIIEIFPKQLKLIEGQAGNWINLPYYNYESTRQYALRGGKELKLDDALSYIKAKKTTLTEIDQLLKDMPYNDGPPCLQTIQLLNTLSKNSGRNNYLFSFGVYLKKKDPEFWEQQLFSINNALDAPLEAQEIEDTIIASLRKKDYTYKCSDAPCCDFCRKSLCKKREYGFGKENGYFSELEYGELIQVKAYEPYYEWEVKALGAEEFTRMRFKNEQDIIGQDAFLRLCFRELHILPPKIKQSEWFKIVNEALANVKILKVKAEDDTAPINLFKMLFIEFLTERAMAQTRDQIANKRVYFDETTKLYYFRPNDLSEYIFMTKNFRYFSPTDLHSLLRDFNAKSGRLRTERGKQLRVFSISLCDIGSAAEEELNKEPFEPEFMQEGDEF